MLLKPTIPFVKYAAFYDYIKNELYVIIDKPELACNGKYHLKKEFAKVSDSEEAGRARITGLVEDYMYFRVPRLRTIEFTAPNCSFGQFATLEADNLDPTLKENYNRISLTEEEKTNLIVFMNTLSDAEFFRS